MLGRAKESAHPLDLPDARQLNPSPMVADITILRANYQHLRARLQRLLAQPEKDMAEVDHLVDDLERLQLDIKAELGIQGNNPNE